MPRRQAVGIAPQLSDAKELVTLAVMQAMLGYTCEGTVAPACPGPPACDLFPYLPQQPGYEQAVAQLRGLLAPGHPLPCDQHLDRDRRRMGSLTPHPWSAAAPGNGRKRSTWPGGPSYRLLRQPQPLLLGPAPAPGLHPPGPARRLRLTGAKADEARDTARPPRRRTRPPRQPPRTDPHRRQELLRPGLRTRTRRTRSPVATTRPQGRTGKTGAHLFGANLCDYCRRSSSRSTKRSKGQLDLERHRGRTPGGVIARVMQRILALTAAIWHNDATGQDVLRSLTAYDH